VHIAIILVPADAQAGFEPTDTGLIPIGKGAWDLFIPKDMAGGEGGDGLLKAELINRKRKSRERDSDVRKSMDRTLFGF
jgi:hypothetical protein